ncbi:MAG TPA: dolichyl-phosphate beta-glucosyltransferase [Pyrinomonadaceae bacterium]|jgi:glycosyltransferase involved in cell wall biosynthesis
MSLSLSVIIPAFNEAARIGKTLPVIFDYLNSQAYESEVIVVDDGSSDETVAIAEKHLGHTGRAKASIIRQPRNHGKGYAVRTGLLSARSPIALFSDADLSTPITEIPKLLKAIEQDDCDLAFGSRALDRNLIGVHQPWRREQGGKFFNLVVRLATGLPFWDTQCGFKAFRLSTCRPIIEAATIERFGFDVEYLYVAHLAGLRLKEVAVRWDHNDGSKLSVVHDSLRAFNEIRLIRQQVQRGVYAQAIELARAAMLERHEASAASPEAVETDGSPKLFSELADR